MTPVLAQKYQPQVCPRLVKINGLLAHQVSNRVDPTRTTGLRNRWAAEMGRRFTALRRLIYKAIVDEDCFGIGPAYTVFRPTAHALSAPAPKAFDFPRLEDKVPAFMAWLQKQQDEGILELVSYPRLGQSLGEPWTNMFVRDSYERGIQRARYELGRAGYAVEAIEATGGLAAAMNNPFHVDRLASMYLRSFDTLKGITADMDKNISHILAQGLADGDAPLVLAKKMNYVISGLGQDLGVKDSLGRFIPAERRAKMLARTEVIRAHAQAQLQEFRVWGAAGVEVEAEFVTAGFNVCPICQELARKGPYTIEQATNLIPVHTHCRCTFRPVPVEGKGKQKQAAIEPETIPWKSSMTYDEAKDFVKNSKYKHDVFHVTDAEGAAGIANKGFDLSLHNFGRVWGDGVYVALDTRSTDLYYQLGEGANLQTLVLKVNISNPLKLEGSIKQIRSNPIFSTINNRKNEFVKELDRKEAELVRKSEELFPFDLSKNREIFAQRRRYLEENGSVGYDLIPSKALTMAVQDLGYDSIIIKERQVTTAIGGSQIVVFDPKKVVVIK